MTFKAHIYAPLPDTAKPVSGPWSFLQVPFLMVLSVLVIGAIGAVIGVVIMMLLNPDMAESFRDGNKPDDEALGQMMNYLMPGYVIAGFGSMIGLAFLKTGAFEKRSLATIGLNKFLYGGGFWGWLISGMVFAALVTASSQYIGGLVGGVEASDHTADWTALQNNGVYLGFGILFLLLMLQAPAEEIFFRGWLMSALSARHGVFWGVAVTSFLFMAPHFFNTMGASAGISLYNLLGVGALGLLLAAISLNKGSVIPAAGFHTGYNFIIFSIGFVQTIVTTGETNFGLMLTQMFDTSAMPEVTMDGQYWADLGARLAITLLPAVYLFRRKPAA